MQLLPEIQEGVLTLLCHDNETAPLVESLVPVDAFDPFYSDVAEAAIRHRHKHGQVPGEHTFDVVRALSVRFPDSEDTYQGIYHSMEELRPGVQPSFVMEEARVWARWQALRKSWIQQGKALDRRDRDGIEFAESAIRDTLRPMADLFDGGKNMGELSDLREILEQEEAESLPTGIPELDNIRCGPARGRLHMFLAPTGRGKSWYLTHLAKHAARKNFRVLYITLEMSEVEVVQRLYQSVFSISESEAIDKVYKIHKTTENGYGGISHISFDEARPTLADVDAESRLERNLAKAQSQLQGIRVKAFAQNQLTVQRLEAFLDGVGMHSGFTPDLICVDYIDLFEKDARDIRGSLRLIAEDLKALAQKRNIAVATVTQTNRGGINSALISEDAVSEDFSKMMTSDSVITYNQTPEEHSVGFARLYVAKNRGGRGKQMLGITQEYGIGQFCLSSCLFNDEMTIDVENQADRLRRKGGDSDPDVVVETIL